VYVVFQSCRLCVFIKIYVFVGFPQFCQITATENSTLQSRDAVKLDDYLPTLLEGGWAFNLRLENPK